MKVCAFARYDLLSTASGVYDGAMLLEGSWPPGMAPKRAWSLDGEIDARFEWIDEAAAYWAEQMAESPVFDTDSDDVLGAISPHWLNVLALRYYLVKLIRVVAYFTEIRPLGYGDVVKLVGVRGRDEEYGDLLLQLCRNAQAALRVRYVDRRERQESFFPPNSRVRRGLGYAARLLGPPTPRGKSHRRVVLCGNAQLLDPVCRELITRRARVWWLYDRFAVKTWLRWRLAGAGQLVCNSSLALANRLVDRFNKPVDCRGVDLSQPIARWIAKCLQTLGPRQTHFVEQIDAHFRRVQPQALVLDEDATPFARAAVTLARRHGARTYVVQHGAPCSRFGFTPPAADQILAWGQSSRWQLTRWSVPDDQINVTGSPRHDELLSTFASQRELPRRRQADGKRKRQVLLLATMPPRDDQPGAVALNFTGGTYTEIIRMAAAAVSGIAETELIVKLHPRAEDDPIVREVLAEFPSLDSRVVRTKPLEKWLAEVDCVLSCASSGGVEATLAGLPVIQLLAPGTGGVLPHEEWGMVGTARDEEQLHRLLSEALSGSRPDAADPDPNVFGNLDAPAAARIAKEVLSDGAATDTQS